MAQTLTFRCFRLDETVVWSFRDPIPPKTKIFGIYLFCVGEATYVASLTPSSWLECIGYETNAPDGPFRDFLYEECCGHCSESDHYGPFISDLENDPRVSHSSFDFEMDPDEDPEQQRAEAWATAREYFSGNAPQFR